MRLLLMPQGQTACLLIKNTDNEPIGSISAEEFFLDCKKKNEYFTRSYHMIVESSKRCPWVGTCTGEKFAKINLHSIIEELIE